MMRETFRETLLTKVSFPCYITDRTVIRAGRKRAGPVGACVLII